MCNTPFPRAAAPLSRGSGGRQRSAHVAILQQLVDELLLLGRKALVERSEDREETILALGAQRGVIRPQLENLHGRGRRRAVRDPFLARLLELLAFSRIASATLASSASCAGVIFSSVLRNAMCPSTWPARSSRYGMPGGGPPGTGCATACAVGRARPAVPPAMPTTGPTAGIKRRFAVIGNRSSGRAALKRPHARCSGVARLDLRQSTCSLRRVETASGFGAVGAEDPRAKSAHDTRVTKWS